MKNNEIDTDLLINTSRELLLAEAEYRSAMNIYKDHPNHRTRIRAEVRWRHAKNIMKAVLDGAKTEREHSSVNI